VLPQTPGQGLVNADDYVGSVAAGVNRGGVLRVENALDSGRNDKIGGNIGRKHSHRIVDLTLAQRCGRRLLGGPLDGLPRALEAAPVVGLWRRRNRVHVGISGNFAMVLDLLGLLLELEGTELIAPS
jgi:hypothetical protein